MKTLIKNTTKESKYIWDDDVEVVLTEVNVVAPGNIIYGLSRDSATLVENVTPPDDWAADKYIYENGFTYSQEYQNKLKAEALAECISNRASAYPPATDYLDGIVKGDQAQVQAYIDACLAVKAKYPKPETPSA